MHWPLSFVFVLCLGLGACGSESPAPQTPPPQQPQPPMPPQAPQTATPRLPDGPHVGILVGFDELTVTSYDQPARVAALLAEARAAGSTIARVQFDWRSIEPSRGVYERADVEDALQSAMNDGDYIFVTFETIDIAEAVFPDYLLGPDGLLAEGLTLSSPEVLDALEDVLEFLVPILGSAQVWGIALGNEVDAYTNDGLGEINDMVTFFERAGQVVNRIDPDIATTVTLTVGAPVDQPALAEGILDAMEIASFNHYCLTQDILVTADEADWQDYFDRMKLFADGKDIFVQELGCPTGFGDDGAGAPPRPANGLGGSPQIQADYFTFVLEAFATDPQLRATTIWQLLDWSPQLATSFSAPTRAVNTVVGDRLDEWLATSGVCRWSDGTCRPAWDAVLQGIEAIEQARPAVP
ncbi:MAG: hypothetical protein AAF221_15100 [Pseudomonadota bacterium]